MKSKKTGAFGGKLFSSERKKKYFERVLLVFAMIMIVESSSAKTYLAQAVDSRQTTLFNESNFLNGVVLNDSSLIYFARLNDVEGLYRFNADTNTTSLLKAFPQIGSRGDPWTGRYHAVDSGLALLSARGKLYATDGTSAGTQLVRDFGAYSCCGSFPTIQSIIKGIYPIDGAFYILTRNDNLPEASSSEIWKTDGTSQGTKKIGSSSYPIKNIFSARINNEESVLYIAGSLDAGMEIWKINSDESTSSIHQFAPNILFSTLGSSPRNRNGVYLCSEVYVPGDPPSSRESDLWRISGSGVVT